MLAIQSAARDGSIEARRAMHGSNPLQIGLFGSNCSSGRAVTLVPERWSGSWLDNKQLAQLADQAAKGEGFWRTTIPLAAWVVPRRSRGWCCFLRVQTLRS